MAEINSTPVLGPRALMHLGIFAVLLVVTLLTTGGPQSAGIRELKLAKLDQNRINAIEIGGKHKAKLSKDGDKWSVEDPDKAGKKFPVEQASIDRALAALADLETGAFVTGRSDKHEELEINDEKGIFLTVRTDDRKQVAIVLGRYAKGGGNYLRKQSSDEVFVGLGSVASAVGKPVDQWRRKKIIEVKEADLTELAIKIPGASPSVGSYQLVRGPSTGEGEEEKPGAWSLAPGQALPEGFRLDEASLGRLPRAFANLRAADFVDDAVTDSGLGADATRVVAKTKAGQTLSVSFGKADDKKRVYTQVDGDPQLYVVNEYSKKNIAKPLLDLRDLTLLPGFDASVVNEVTLEGPAGKVVLKKEAGTWSVASGTPPADKVFDASTVQGKLTQMSRLKGAAFLGQGAGTAFKPGKPLVRLSFVLEGDVLDGKRAPRTLTFSNVLAASGDQPANQVAVKVSDGYVYRVAKYQKDRYEKPWDLFKKVAPPPGRPGGGGGIPGMENLPPDIRKQLEAQLRSGQLGGN